MSLKAGDLVARLLEWRVHSFDMAYNVLKHSHKDVKHHNKI